MTYTDAFTGEEFEGKAVILNTTEGPEFVRPGSLDSATAAAPADLVDVVAGLAARVEELEDRLRECDADATAAAPEDKPQAKTVSAKSTTTTRRTTS